MIPDWRYIVLAALIATLIVLIIFWPHPYEHRYELTEAEWNEQYDEAMQWRDWQTCDYLIEARANSAWYHDLIAQQIDADEEGAGSTVPGSTAVSPGLTAATGAPYDWQAGGGWAA